MLGNVRRNVIKQWDVTARNVISRGFARKLLATVGVSVIFRAFWEHQGSLRQKQKCKLSVVNLYAI